MRINEIFYSIQGEGAHTGTPAVFVRFSGCNRSCAFCDTAHSFFTEMTEDEIVAAAQQFPARYVIVTGGEPALQLTDSLVDKLHRAGFRVHVETNGTLPLPEAVDWVTCSPKGGPYGSRRIDELKIVFQNQDVEAIACELPRASVYCLQPLSGMNVAETVEYVKSNPRWRLSLQTHKLIDIP